MERSVMSILQLINKHSGEWTWYQLARSNAGVQLAIDGEGLMGILNTLKALRYIYELRSCPNPLLRQGVTSSSFR